MTITPRRTVSALAIATMIAAGGVTTLGQGPAEAQSAPQPGNDYVDLVAELSPAVVTIEVTKTRQNAQFEREMPQGDFPWEEFMRRFGMPEGHGQMPPRGMPDRQMQGTGTGFAISADGTIVTNAHVVSDADEVTVTLEDGREFDAEVIGLDEATDLAVLEIDATDLDFVEFGDSTTLRVGQNVIAIGNPFGLGNTVTTGIVSALGRDINAGPFDDFIQTDAAINRGNSGGPLFNEAGEVVGVNTAIISPTGGSVGIGFSVPSEIAAEVVTDLTDDGEVERGWLGVRIAPVSEDVARALGFDDDTGVMIESVQNDTPAAAAGLQDGDIVMSVNGDTMGGPRDLTRAIAIERPGAEVEIEVLRRGETESFTVELGNRADMPT
ncbi:putative periplasmic serine endoprotease DegP-like precursor [Roseivivax jejudonensis]|uniref:Putative periplasmic serine endoprotease DegP-like n=1 Tax=Roseivivax jejudonensis TaxID=1529041 RepID=A0A1X7A3P9_9RHOB|nr:trypsin-like peptidase domain-containing protein [Roseivivax jejudonensis]SLN69139.1 putative periplasmic serine endoprotease DegP-like precursor [Roseivivax jejudonensis]